MTRRILPLVLVLLAAGSVWAQEPARIIGTVTSMTGQPVSGASVQVLGTGRGSVTGPDGQYAVVGVPAGTHQVRVSLIGYGDVTREVTVVPGEGVVLDFRLESQAVSLDEIVVVGYGTQERRTVTAAVATVSAEQLSEVATANPIKALQGRIPGVEVVAASNLPGAPMNIRIRGVRSLTASNEPLYVVDGIPLAGGIGDFNPANIRSIDVLKDAAATAVYGSRGANGVVLITTKTGAASGAMETRFTADMYTGWQRPMQLIDMMNMDQYVAMLQAAARYAGVDDGVDAVLSNNRMREAYESGTETDWQRAILRTGIQRNFQIGMSGSTGNTLFNLSGNYFDQDGLAVGQAYNRGSGTVSIRHTMGRLDLGVSATGLRSVRDEGAGDGLWGMALAQTGFGAPYDANGVLIARPDGEANAFNPLRTQEVYVNQTTRSRIFASAFADLELYDGINWRVNFGPDYTSMQNGEFIGPNAIYPANEDARANQRNMQTFAYTLDNLLQVSRDFGPVHHLDATLLYGVQKQRETQHYSAAQQLPYDAQLWYALNTGAAPVTESSLSEWTLESYMGRISYTLSDRYTVSAALRRDGSSRLADGNKWATFPSFGLAWQLGDESFMQSLDFLNGLKLRGSYGVTGNTAIQPYQTQGALIRTVYNFGGGNGFGYGPNQGSPANPELSWEKSYQWDVGVEFSALDSRVAGTVDVYRVNTKDLLVRRTLPATAGYTGALQNVGETMNSGVEIGLSTMPVQDWNGLTWTLDVGWSHNHNEIVELATADTIGCPINARPCDLNNGWFVGQPINIEDDNQRRVWYDYKMIGIWQQGEEDLAQSFGTQFKPGEIRLLDVNGDGTITSADQMILGSTYPKWRGSLYNRVSWRNLDFSALITARWGYTLFDEFGTGANAMQGRLGNIVTDYWTAENPSNTQPAPRLSGNVVPYSSTRGYLDGSHWRIRNITVGYTLPPSLAGRFGASHARFYATAQDPYVFTDYEGYDPENGMAGGAPAYRTLLIGVNLGW